MLCESRVMSRFTSHLSPVLRLCEGRVMSRNTGYVLAGACSVVIEDDCLALAEVCALLCAHLVIREAQ